MSTYLLVHGSWHGAWCWYKITARLKAAGHTVIVPDMPGHGRDWRPPGELTMQDFVDTITQAIDAANEPVVLVVHSRNGIVATQATVTRDLQDLGTIKVRDLHGSRRIVIASAPTVSAMWAAPILEE